MKEFWGLITSLTFTDIVDIFLVGCLFYLLFALLRETRSRVALRGLIFLLLLSFVVFFLAKSFSLSAIEFIFERFWIIVVLAFMIVFQNEFKRALTTIGNMPIFRVFFSQDSQFAEEIVRATQSMAQRKIGALIAIERQNPLRVYAETGTPVDATVSSELIRTIFTPFSPLHDGAVVVRNDQLVAAACLLPLSDDPTLSKELGTRHRAAVGLSEETDAVVIVVSEETGTVSVAVNGRLERRLDPEGLRDVLEREIHIRESKRKEEDHA